MKLLSYILLLLLLPGVSVHSSAQNRSGTRLAPLDFKTDKVDAEGWQKLRIEQFPKLGLTLIKEYDGGLDSFVVITSLPARVSGLFDFPKLANKPQPGTPPIVSSARVFNLLYGYNDMVVFRWNKYGLPEPGVYRVEYSQILNKVRFIRLE